MNLTKLERRFIRVISENYAGRIERCLSLRPVINQSRTITRRSRLATLLVNLARYGQLSIELVKAAWHKPEDISGVIFFDRDSKSQVKRIAYLKHIIGDVEFIGISRERKLRPLPDWFSAARTMIHLLLIILLATFDRQSRLTSSFVWITRYCFSTLGFVSMSKTEKTIYLFRISSIESPFIAGYLKEHGIRVSLIASMTPLSFYNRVLVGDSLKMATAYQCDEADYYQPLEEPATYEFWAPETIHLMVEHYDGMVINEHHNTVGVYTQGFWLRNKLGLLHPDVAQDYVKRETELLSVMLEWVKRAANTRLVIFPHPLERRHLHKTGEHQFIEALKGNQVEVDLSDSNISFLLFDRVGLGVTTLSSIGFERIHMGFRTVFFTFPVGSAARFPNLSIQSRYNDVFISNRSDFLKAVDRVRKMKHREYMNNFFGRESFLN